MKNIILFDPDTRDQLLPLTFTRPMSALRVGIRTIGEKWAHEFGGRISYITQDYLTDKYPIHISDDNYVINGSILPNAALCKLIGALQNNEALQKEGELVAARLDRMQFQNLMTDNDIEELVGFEVLETPFDAINYAWDIFKLNDKAIKDDFQHLTEGRHSAPLSTSNRVIGDAGLIFLESGARVECAILNTENGPIYVGEGSEIMEGCLVRGPFAMCAHSLLKMGTKIYGATTLGPYCKVGGEVNNAVLLGYSSKAHDGYLGNSVIGEWCNLGADTNTSNLKNTYEEVKLWDYTKNSYGRTGLQFLGLIMGDHSKCGINTMFNTGTVVGVSANIFGAGFARNFVPSFSWGGPQGYETYDLTKAFYTIERVLARRDAVLSDVDRAILTQVFERSAKYRAWEKQPVL